MATLEVKELARIEHVSGQTRATLILWTDGTVTWDSIVHRQELYRPTP